MTAPLPRNVTQLSQRELRPVQGLDLNDIEGLATLSAVARLIASIVSPLSALDQGKQATPSSERD